MKAKPHKTCEGTTLRISAVETLKLDYGVLYRADFQQDGNQTRGYNIEIHEMDSDDSYSPTKRVEIPMTEDGDYILENVKIPSLIDWVPIDPDPAFPCKYGVLIDTNWIESVYVPRNSAEDAFELLLELINGMS